MSGNDFIALVIAGGYVGSAYLLWRNRAAFPGIKSLQWVVVPAVAISVLFYASLPFVNQAEYLTFYTWLSRVPHGLAIALILLVARIGGNILESQRRGGTDDRTTTE